MFTRDGILCPCMVCVVSSFPFKQILHSLDSVLIYPTHKLRRLKPCIRKHTVLNTIRLGTECTSSSVQGTTLSIFVIDQTTKAKVVVQLLGEHDACLNVRRIIHIGILSPANMYMTSTSTEICITIR